MQHSAPHRNHNLPTQTTPFIGRDAELTALGDLLGAPDCRLLTLVGPGGIGKTRLALETAARWQTEFADGVWFVPLQPVAAAEFIAPAIAHALGFALTGHVPPNEHLLDTLRDKHLLLILDNFEQLLPARGETLLLAMLAEAPHVRLLVTSRETLNVQEEWLYPVAGMPFPDDQNTSAQAFSAVSLFAERAQRIRRDFDAQAEEACIRRICRLVEGMPLALELAATWVKSLPCDAIADEISRNLDFLATNLRNLADRHRSMQAVFDSSWALLTPHEQATFARLSVFRGTFDHDAAAQVAGASLHDLSALVDKSMLQVRPGGRYTLHELLRQYAAEHLERIPDAASESTEAHSAYYAGVLRQQLPHLVSGRQVEAMHQLLADDDNIRSAWQYAIEQRRLTLLEQAAEPLALHYRYQSRHTESLAIFEKALDCIDQAGREPASDYLRLVILMALVWSDIRLGRLDDAETRVQPCLDLSDRLDTLPLSGYAANPLVPLAGISLFRGDYARAYEVAEQALHFSLMRDHPSSRYRALYVLTRAARGLGHYQQAQDYAEQTYVTARDHNDPWFMAYGLSELGNLALAAQDYENARAHFEAAYALRQKIDDPEGMARAAQALGVLYLEWGRYEDAQAHFQTSWSGYQQIRDAEGMASTLQSLARVARKRGDELTACNYLLRALELVGDIDAAPAAFPVLYDAGTLLMDHELTEKGVRALLLVAHHPLAAHAERERASALLRPYPVSFAGLDEYPLGRALREAHAALASLTGDSDGATSSNDWSAQELMAMLSEREREVLRLLAEAMTNQQIADTLFVGVSTVKKHINHIYSKLGISNRVQALHLARKLPPRQEAR